MMRTNAPRSVKHTSRSLPRAEWPVRNSRRSPKEWSGSSWILASGSANAVAASSNETPCLRTFKRAFRGSHVNFTCGVYDRRGALQPSATRMTRSASLSGLNLRIADFRCSHPLRQGGTLDTHACLPSEQRSSRMGHSLRRATWCNGVDSCKTAPPSCPGGRVRSRPRARPSLRRQGHEALR